jgi:hypothetical protein
MPLWVHLLFWFLLPVHLCAQENVKLIAKTNADRVLPRESVEITYSLENARGTGFTAPDFSPFEVLSGPSVSNSIQIINGRQTSSISYSFVLAAPGPGRYQIPAARIQVDGKRIVSNRLSLEVVPRSSSSTRSAEQSVFARYELSTDSPYVGEPLMLDLVLYSTKRVHNVYKRSDPDRSEWYRINFPMRPTARRTVLQGVSYYRQVLMRELLFGQKSGRHSIDRLYLQVGLEKKNNGRSSPFSFFKSYDRKEVYVPDTNVWVRSLPQPSPPQFSGLVGPTALNGQLKQNRIIKGEAAAYVVRLESYSDPNVVAPPRLRVEGAEVLQPTLSRESNKDALKGRKYVYIYEYLIVPDSLGAYSIQPEITYFDTQTNKYTTASGPPQDLWVMENQEVTAQGDLEHSEGVADPISPGSESTNGFSWWWLSVPFLLGLLVLVFRFQNGRKGQPVASASEEQRFKELLAQERPEPKDLRLCLEALIEKYKVENRSAQKWKNYLRDLDYLVFSPSADESDWLRILNSWRKEQKL